MDFESPDVEKDFPGLYASESGRKSNESDFSDGGDHDKPSKKELLIGRRKDKKDKKDRGYAALEGESSPEEDTETKSPSKSKKTKSFKFPSKSREKREKSREKERAVESEPGPAERDRKAKDKDKKEKDKKEKHKEKEKEEKAKFKLESKEKSKDKDKEKTKEKEKEKVKEKEKEKVKEKEKEKVKEKEKDKVKEKEKDKVKEKEKDKVKEKEKDKVKEKDKDKKDKKVNKIQTVVTSGVPFEEIFTLGVALPIFGVPLQASIERSRCHDDTRLPLVVRDSIDYLQMHGVRSPLAYRAEAERVKVQQLRRLYEERGATFPYHWDVPVACATLKAFLSELPESILTQELSGQFEQATAMAEEERDTAIAALVGRLPAPNRTLLAWLMLHFREVVAHEAVNHVTVQVLATVMGPALNMSLNLLTHFITKADKLFPDVELSKYVPPLQSIPPQLTRDSPTRLAAELRKLESLLSQIHAEMHAGFVTPAREEQLWEGQRIVTQLKRMLRSAQKSMESSVSMQQASIDEKGDEEPAPLPSAAPSESTTQGQPTTQQSSDSELNKTPSTVASNDAFQPDKSKESLEDLTQETFEDDFGFNPKESSLEVPEDTTDLAPNEIIDEKPKLTENELKLLKLQLENAEYLQLKSLLQAKINSEQFEIVKLRSCMAIKNKLENNMQAKDNKENVDNALEDAELRQKLIKDNAALEQKRLSLINQIFQERVACIQLKIELAMKEIL